MQLLLRMSSVMDLVPGFAQVITQVGAIGFKGRSNLQVLSSRFILSLPDFA